jgi:hypothetical protein
MLGSVGLESALTHFVDRGVKIDAEVGREGDNNVERIAHDIDRPGGRAHVDGGMAAVEHERVVCFHEDGGIGRVRDLLLHLDANRRDLAACGGMERLSEQLLEPLPGDVPQRVFAERVDVLGCRFIAIEDAEHARAAISLCARGSYRASTLLASAMPAAGPRGSALVRKIRLCSAESPTIGVSSSAIPESKTARR